MKGSVFQAAYNFLSPLKRKKFNLKICLFVRNVIKNLLQHMFLFLKLSSPHLSPPSPLLSTIFELCATPHPCVMPPKRETLQQIKERTAREIRQRTQARIALLYRQEEQKEESDEEQNDRQRDLVVPPIYTACLHILCLIVLLLLVNLLFLQRLLLSR